MLKFENPGPSRRGRTPDTDWDAVADELRDNPNRWAIIKEDTTNTSLVTSIKKARLVAFAPAGSFDAVTRSRGESTDSGKRRLTVYARYVG